MQPSIMQPSPLQPPPLQPPPLQPAAVPKASLNLFETAISQALSQATSDGVKTLRDGWLGAGTPMATQDDRLIGPDAPANPELANPLDCQRPVTAPDDPSAAVPPPPAAAPPASLDPFGAAAGQAPSRAASDGPKSLRDGRLSAGTPIGAAAPVSPKLPSPLDGPQLVSAPDEPSNAVPPQPAAEPLQPAIPLLPAALAAQPLKAPAPADLVGKPTRPATLAAVRPASPDADEVDGDLAERDAVLEPPVMAPQAPGSPVVPWPSAPLAKSGPDATPAAPAGHDVVAIAEPGVAAAPADRARTDPVEAASDKPAANLAAALPMTAADASPSAPHADRPSLPTPPVLAAPRMVLQHIQDSPRAAAAAPVEQVSPALASFTANSALPGAPRQLIIRLDPAELGRVQLRIDRTLGGPARVELLVERPETLLLLLRDQPQLHRALDLAGVPATDRTLQFQLAQPEPHRSPLQAGAEFSDGSGPGQHRSGHSQRGASARSAAPDDSTAHPATPHPASVWRRASVDITA